MNRRSFLKSLAPMALAPALSLDLQAEEPYSGPMAGMVREVRFESLVHLVSGKNGLDYCFYGLRDIHIFRKSLGDGDYLRKRAFLIIRKFRWPGKDVRRFESLDKWGTVIKDNKYGPWPGRVTLEFIPTKEYSRSGTSIITYYNEGLISYLIEGIPCVDVRAIKDIVI